MDVTIVCFEPDGKVGALIVSIFSKITTDSILLSAWNSHCPKLIVGGFITDK